MIHYDASLVVGEFEFAVRGERSLFTRPESRTNRMSSPIPSGSAIDQIARGIYWHPCIDMHVKKIKILSGIEYESMMFNHRDEIRLRTKQSNQTYLRNPHYLVSGVMLWNADRLDLRSEWIPNKHMSILNRRILRGTPGHPVVLGTSECLAEISSIDGSWDDYVSPLVGEIDLGLLYYNKDHKTGVRYLKRMIAIDGVVDYDNTDIIAIK